MSIDLSFLGSVFSFWGIPSRIADYGVLKEYLTDEGQQVYALAETHYVKFGKVPSEEVFVESLGIIPEFNATEPPEYYSEKIISRYKENTLRPGLAKAIQELQGQDPDKAVSVLKDIVLQCNKVGAVDVGCVVDANMTSVTRGKEYLEKVNNPTIVQGAPWPWPTLTKETGGMHKGELYFIVARLKQGKTWTLISAMKTLSMNEVPTMVVTMEMPVDRILRRFDSMYANISFPNFINGTMTQGEQDQYLQAMDFLSKTQAPMHVVGNGKIKNVQDIELMIEELKPRVVLVDGVYLLHMAGLGKNNKWERVSAVVDELQKIAQRKQVSILATTQFNRGVRKGEKNVDSSDIGFAYEIAQASDMVMGLIQDDDMKQNKEMVVKIMERREGETFNLKLHWDFMNMDFTEIGVVTDEELNIKKNRGDDDVETIF